MHPKRCWYTVPLRLRSLFRGRAVERDLDDEVRFHLEMQVDRYVARGMAPAEARRAARRQFGGVEQRKEECRDMRHVRLVDELVRDIRYAIRGFLHAPVFTAVVLLTLALGIGANTAIFSILDGLLLRALPVRDPGRLVLLSGRANNLWTYPIWDETRRRPELFDGACAYSTAQIDLARSGESDMVEGLWTSGRFFDVLGVNAVLGRTFRDEDDRHGGGADGPVAVISYAFWQRRFAGATDVVGRTMTVDRSDVPVRIVGVTAPAFSGPEVGRAFDVAIPIGAIDVLSAERPSRLDRRQTWWLAIMARLRPGQTMASAISAIQAVQPQIRTAVAPAQIPRPFSLMSAATGVSALRVQYERPLAVLMALVALVLLVACANVANLQLVRAAARGHEFSMRRALGASRLRLARQVLTESLLLAAVGAALGLLVARWGSHLLVRQLSTSFSTTSLDVRFDWRLLGFATTVAAATAIVFGLLPAVRAARADGGDALRDARGSVGPSRNLVGHALVVVQVGLSLALVIGAGLFVRSFSALATLNLGIDTDRVLAVEMHGARAMPATERSAFLERVQQAAASVAGVERASLSSVAPVSGRYNGTPLRATGMKPMTDEERYVLLNDVSPGWFASFGIRVVAGRDFSARDRAGERPVVVVNRAFAKRFFGDESRIGRTVFNPAFDGQRLVEREADIVGVVEDSVYHDVRTPVLPTVYLAFGQMQAPGLRPARACLFVRSVHGSPLALARGVVSAIEKLDPTLSLRLRTMRDQVDAAGNQERLIAMLSAFFGLLALLLAGVGVFGVTAYGVHRRRAEIGLRMALGASQAGVVRLVLGRVTTSIAVGVVLGGAACFWAARFVKALLFGIGPHDPFTFAGAAVVLALVGLLAAALPARRASQIDPATVMRSL